MTEEERVRTGRLARMGSIFILLLAVVACSNTATPSPPVVTSSAVPPTPSAIPTPSPTASPLPTATPSPLPTATPSPRPMAPATLKPGPKMTTARLDPAAVRLKDGRVLIIGGTIPFVGKCPMACMSPVTASVEDYDPRTGKFSHNGSLSEPRSGAEALLLNDGRVLVSGGNGQYGQSLSTLEIYDAAKGTAVVVKPPADIQKLPVDPTVLLLADGRVLVAGGSYDDLITSSNVTLIFDPASGGFSKGPLMAEDRQGAAATLLDDGRVLIVGGDYYRGLYGYQNNNAELFDPSHPLSQPSLPLPMSPVSSTLLSDGRVLVSGWSSYDNGSGCAIPIASEVFDPMTGNFAVVGPMKTPRTGSAAIAIKDGRVLVFGGVDSKCAATGTVEAFDPDTGTFQVVASGFPKISDFSATLLDDGEILIAGGGSGDWNGMTVASWLIKP